MGTDSKLFCRTKKDPKVIEVVDLGRLYYYEGLPFQTGEEGWTDNMKRARREVKERLEYIKTEEWREGQSASSVVEWQPRYEYALKHLKAQLDRGWKKWSEVVIAAWETDIFNDIIFCETGEYTVVVLEDITVEEDFLDDV